MLGERAPLFVGKTPDLRDFWLSSTAGRYVLLCFHDSLSLPESVAGRDDLTVVWIVRDAGLATGRPGITVVDGNSRIAEGYGAIGAKRAVLLDPNLRVHSVLDGDDAIATALRELPSDDRDAPVLLVPRVFEPELCARLVAEFERQGGEESGFVRDDSTGRTVEVLDHSHKSRRDVAIRDPLLRNDFRTRIERRLVPEIQRAYQFAATRIERYIVACYDAGAGGHFAAHRDNTTRGTAHRRFAVMINLNAGEYRGGELRFPEFGRRTYAAGTGDALVFPARCCTKSHR